MGVRNYLLSGCPHCGGKLPRMGVDTCLHCNKTIVWYVNVVGKPGQEAECRDTFNKLDEAGKKLDEAERKKREQARRILLYCLLLFTIIFVLAFFLMMYILS